MRIAQWINIALLTLVAGVFWGTWFSLSRSMPSITPGTFLEVGRAMIQNLGRPMSILMPVAILSTLPVMFLLLRRKATTALYVACAGLILFVGALLITLIVNVPIDNQIRQWTVATLPSDWRETRDRWEFYHSIRTFASLAGLGCAVASALMLDDGKRNGGRSEAGTRGSLSYR